MPMTYQNNSDKRILTGAAIGGIAGVALSLYAAKLPDMKMFLETAVNKVFLVSIGAFAGGMVGGMLCYDPRYSSVFSDPDSHK